jgi:phosphonate transport system substrate-binding protein
MSTGPEFSAPKSTFSLARVLMVVLPATLIIAAVYALTAREFERASREKEQTLQAEMGFGQNSAPLHLDKRFTDADGDLVADTPQDPAKQISPAKLIFSYIGASNADAERDNWKEFVVFLSKQTDKPVDLVVFKSTEDQIQALDEGKLHITGFNTGSVPEAVNTAGFVPVCTSGRDDGTIASYTMQIIVPNDSSIRAPIDLKGHTIAFTDRTSNSGYKAALVHLKDLGLLPQRDYNCRFSTGHELSIQGVASGEYQAAAIASNMLQTAVANGTVDLAKVRVIEESKSFPPATFGYAYNLAPDLAEKIKAAFFAFHWPGTGLEKQFAGTGATKFVPVSYKNDFEWTRLIAESVQDPPDVAIEHDQANQQ